MQLNGETFKFQDEPKRASDAEAGGFSSKFPDEPKIATDAEAGGFSKVMEHTRKDIRFEQNANMPEADILAIKEILMLLEKVTV